jgi:hypothetical protein
LSFLTSSASPPGRGIASELWTNARLAWLEAVLRERLHPELTLCLDDDLSMQLMLEGASGSVRFDASQRCFFEPGQVVGMQHWDAQCEGWSSVESKSLPAPSNQSLPNPLIAQVGEVWRFQFDLPGLIFWSLNRIEEVGATPLDRHGRFTSTNAHAGRHGYLDRPWVDEWLHILRQLLRRAWPQANWLEPTFEMTLSHDVDQPLRYGLRPLRGLIRDGLQDARHPARWTRLAAAPWVWLTSRTQLSPRDPANTFDWIMERSSQHGIRSAFYFLCGRTDPRMDAGYEVEDTSIRHLLRRIHGAGHEIGLHPSYNCVALDNVIQAEADRLRRVCKEEGIFQSTWGGRMHYLRWQQPATLLAWEAAGLSYDSTMGYADRAGFRCGTCFEYPAFDARHDRCLKLRVRPLVAMECTVTDEAYMGLGLGREALQAFALLKQRCRAVGGQFTLLWHNSELTQLRQRALYESVLEC